MREQETLDTFASLMEKKKILVQLVQESFNRSSAALDISLADELDELRRIISGQ